MEKNKSAQRGKDTRWNCKKSCTFYSATKTIADFCAACLRMRWAWSRPENYKEFPRRAPGIFLLLLIGQAVDQLADGSFLFFVQPPVGADDALDGIVGTAADLAEDVVNFLVLI